MGYSGRNLARRKNWTDMQIHLHLGVHYTDQQRLLQAFLKSRADLEAAGIRLGDPAVWHSALRSALSARGRSRLPRDWVERTLGSNPLRRLLIFDEDLLGQPLHVIRDGAFYAEAGARVRDLAEAFSDHVLTFSVALTAPERYVHSLLARYDPDGARGFRDELDPAELSWEPMIRSIREAAPEIPLLIWRHEDLPLIWPTLLRDIAGLSGEQTLAADDDLLEELLPAEGVARMRRYLAARTPRSETQYRQVLRSFLTLFGAECFASGKAGRLQESAAARKAGRCGYSDDFAAISHMPGVSLLRV